VQGDYAEVALDRCLDRILNGQDWRLALSSEDPLEVRQLMEVAELVFATARRMPAVEPEAKQRLWSRLFGRFAEMRLWEGLRMEVQRARAAAG
jgi:hypothetical protein